MKKFWMLLMMMLCNLSTAQAMNVDAFVDKHIAPVSDAIAKVIFCNVSIFGNKIPLIILWVLAAGIFFTIYFKGISLWGLKHAVENVAGKGDGKGEGTGEVSSFQALATALSASLMARDFKVSSLFSL